MSIRTLYSRRVAWSRDSACSWFESCDNVAPVNRSVVDFLKTADRGSQSTIIAIQTSLSEMTHSVGSPDSRIHLKYKVLRIQQKGRFTSTQWVRISSEFHSRNSLAVKGDALNHGPHLVARPVGSEWRTRRPHQVRIHTNQNWGDQT